MTLVIFKISPPLNTQLVQYSLSWFKLIIWFVSSLASESVICADLSLRKSIIQFQTPTEWLAFSIELSMIPIINAVIWKSKSD